MTVAHRPIRAKRLQFATLIRSICSLYIDGNPLFQAGVPEVREYMLRGVIADEEIGLDSDIQSIAWGGN